VAFPIPGFDHRLGWSQRLAGDVPVWLTAISLGMVAGGFLFVFWVLKVNSYAGARSKWTRADGDSTARSLSPS
jgi:hypothetical protein